MGRTLAGLGVAGCLLTLLGSLVTFGDVALLAYPLLLLVASGWCFARRTRAGVVAGALLVLLGLADLTFYTPVSGEDGKDFVPDWSALGRRGLVVGSALAVAGAALATAWGRIDAAWKRLLPAAALGLGFILLSATPARDLGEPGALTIAGAVLSVAGSAGALFAWRAEGAAPPPAAPRPANPPPPAPGPRSRPPRS